MIISIHGVWRGGEVGRRNAISNTPPPPKRCQIDPNSNEHPYTTFRWRPGTLTLPAVVASRFGKDLTTFHPFLLTYLVARSSIGFSVFPFLLLPFAGDDDDDGLLLEEVDDDDGSAGRCRLLDAVDDAAVGELVEAAPPQVFLTYALSGPMIAVMTDTTGAAAAAFLAGSSLSTTAENSGLLCCGLRLTADGDDLAAVMLS